MSESEVLIRRIFLIWSRRPFSVMARSNRYSETVFSHEQHLLAGEIFSCRPLRTSSGVVAVGVVADQDGGGGDAGGGGHVERLHVGHGAGVDVLGHEGVQRRRVVEALHLDGDAVLVGPLVQDARTYPCSSTESSRRRPTSPR